MSRVIVVDFDKDIYLNNKDSVVYINKYEGDKQDDQLKNLSLFLNKLA